MSTLQTTARIKRVGYMIGFFTLACFLVELEYRHLSGRAPIDYMARLNLRKYRPSAPGALMPMPIDASLVDIKAYHIHMQNASTYLEYGAGGSTTMAGLLIGGTTYTIDARASWCENVRTHPTMAQREASGRSKFLCPPPPDREYGVFESHKDDVSTSSRHFVEAPEWYLLGKTVDLILVDSDFRVACALFASKYMREDSRLIIHDFIDNPAYHVIMEHLEPVMAPETAEARNLFRKYGDVVYLDFSQAGNRLTLPVLGGRESEFRKTGRRMAPSFAVFKLRTQPQGFPINEYKHFLGPPKKVVYDDDEEGIIDWLRGSIKLPG